MPLNFLSQPTTITLARNPAIFKILCDSDGLGTLYDAVGVRSVLAAMTSDRFATNETITVVYTEPDGTSETVVFTAKASPSNAAHFYDAGYAGSNYWGDLATVIGSHSRIAPFFTVTADSTVELVIKAKSVAAGWALTVTNSHGFAVAAYAAAASTLPPNYRVLLEVYMEDTYLAGNYTQVARLDGRPAEGTGLVYFDIASVLAARTRSTRIDPLVPEYGASAAFQVDNTRRYYARMTEEYGEPPVAQDWTYSGGIKTVIDGGVAMSTFAEGDFLSALDSADAILSWLPDGRKIGLYQPEYLLWYAYGDNQVKLEMKWYSIVDGVASASSYFYNSIDALEGESIAFPISPAILGLDAEANAYKFSVRVVEYIANSARSQWRTYYIDRDYYESERYLMYLNSFGLPECCRCTGNWGKKLRVDRATAQRPLTPGFNALASDRFQYGRLWDHELTYRTGYITRAEADALQELLLAGEVYDVSTDGYIPLQITSNDFTVTGTRQELHSYQFTAQPRMDMKNYSKKKLSAALADSWQEPGGDSWFQAFLMPWELP